MIRDSRDEATAKAMRLGILAFIRPVIVFGTAASVIYGVVLWLLGG